MKKKVKHLLRHQCQHLFRTALLLIALFMAGAIYAQTLPRDEYFNSELKTHEFSQDNWVDITEGLDYNNVAADNVDQSATDQRNSNRSNTNHSGSSNSSSSRYSGSASPFWVTFFKVLAVIMAIGVLAILVVHLFGGGGLFVPKSKKVPVTDNKISIEDIEANIHESDLDRHIREAIEQNNYPLAIRLYYLAIIKELSINRWIKWKRDKTNKDYLREIRDTNLFKPYREVTRIFERAWYGQSELGKEDFQNLKPQFVDMINQAKRTNS